LWKAIQHLAGGGTGGRGQRGHGSNTTVVAPVPGHEDVATHAPRGSPTVLYDPVVLAASGTITNSKHTVIKGSGAAGRLIIDTTRIELEGVLGSIDGDAGGAEGNLGLEIRLTAGGNVDIGGEFGTAVGSVVLAGSVLSLVGVRGLGINAVVGDDVLEGISHEATIASLVSLGSGAINQVLLREADEGASAECVSTFNRASGRERPARSALTLVLDTSHNTLGPPINRCGESGNVDLERRLGEDDVNMLQTLEEAVEFVAGEISELVETNSESDISTLVELSDPRMVVLPDGVPGLELIGGINLVVFPHPFGETRLEVPLGAQRGTYEEGEQEESDNRTH